MCSFCLNLPAKIIIQISMGIKKKHREYNKLNILAESFIKYIIHFAYIEYFTHLAFCVNIFSHKIFNF